MIETPFGPLVHPRYAEWLRFVFDRPVTSNGWYFDFDIEPFNAEPLELVGLIGSTFEYCGRDLAGYSNDQLSHGLSYIFNNFCSDCVYSLMSDDVPLMLRLEAIGALKKLYSDVLDHRCAPVQARLDEQGGNALNNFCYMLWDVSPLARPENSTEKAVLYNAVSDVLNHAVRSANPACVESALHGLGHMMPYYPERAEAIIDEFLETGVTRFAELRQYAQAARTGNVQ